MNGKTWNRVRLGPYASASELEVAKAALSDNGFNAIALKEEINR
ncbi:MAG: SPOR domain-containing protein [Dokdonella sp.]